MHGAVRKTLKVVAWTVGGIVGLCVTLYVIAVAINWRDSEPSAAAIQFANAYRDRPAVADADNAYVYLKSIQGSSAKHTPLVQAYLDACKRASRECPDALSGADKIVAQWSPAERELLERYHSFIAHSGWRESVEEQAQSMAKGLVVGYTPAMEGQKLLMLEARIRAAKGDAAGVRRMLEEDLVFWRRILASSDILISKMIATAALNRHFELGNLVLRALPRQKVASAVPPTWRLPISDAERSMLRCLVGEWEFSAATMTEMEGFGTEGGFDRITYWLGMRLHQPQDTRNRFADHSARIVSIMNVPLDRYPAALDAASEEVDRRRNEDFPPRSPYNMIGGVLFAIGASDYRTYTTRVADLEGVRRATLAAVSMRQAKVPTEGMPTALASSTLRNPYDNRPFAWDATDRVIVFTGLELGERGEHRIYY